MLEGYKKMTKKGVDSFKKDWQDGAKRGELRAKQYLTDNDKDNKNIDQYKQDIANSDLYPKRDESESFSNKVSTAKPIVFISIGIIISALIIIILASLV